MVLSFSTPENTLGSESHTAMQSGVFFVRASLFFNGRRCSSRTCTSRLEQIPRMSILQMEPTISLKSQ
jgi:hypothetical protein